MNKMILAAILVSLALTLTSRAIAEEENEGLLSPYFFVNSDDPSVDAFPLLETKVNVNISGIIAEVELVQVYKNEGKQTIEAIYVFPLGTKAAIHKMRMKIGERIINARIEERRAAKAIYNQAKQDGKVTSLLEQQRPNVFQMNVANIMPGDAVEVTVGYTELLIPEGGIYQYVYPAVVGPRYGGEVTEPQETDNFISSPYLKEGEEPSYDFEIKVQLNAGMPLSKVWVASHQAIVEKDNDTARISLAEDEKKGGNRDFILRNSMEGKEIQTGILLYPGDEENFFLLMAQPPQNISTKDIPPREYVFIVDVSGSMNGFPLDVLKALITDIITDLRKEDYFNILFFSGGSKALSEKPLPATKQNVKRAIAMLNNQRGGGGTNMLSALQRAVSLKKKEGLSRTVVIATDGYVGVEKQAFDQIRDNLSEANVFAFGIGSSVNRYLIEGIARAGRGEPFIVINQKEAKQTAERFQAYVESPLLTDIEAEFIGFDAYDVEPVNIPDLFAQRPLIIYGKYRNPKGEIIIKGNCTQGCYRRHIKVNDSLESKDNLALRYLWARERIARLSDYAGTGTDLRDEVTDLGLKYTLMTKYTSFVAVDTVIRDTGEAVTVKQPLPLPQGVSNYAVGGAATYSKSARYSFGQARCEKSIDLCDSELAIREEEKKRIEVYLKGGKFPKEVSMQEAERLLKPLKEKLARLFKEWELKKIALVLTVEKGRLKKLHISSHEGKGYDQKKLTSILKGLNFSKTFTGTLGLNLIAW